MYRLLPDRSPCLIFAEAPHATLKKKAALAVRFWSGKKVAPFSSGSCPE
jgi:hypothetical protein